VTSRDEPTVYIALHAFEQNETGVSFIKPDSLTIKVGSKEGNLSVYSFFIRDNIKRGNIA
jgi:hypothetical protein